MPRIDDEDKRNRSERIYLLLTRNARGLTEGEIAEEVRIDRRTVNNYLRELEQHGRAFKDGIYWYPLVLKESRLRSFDLSPEEAVTLYLGARLLSKQQDKRNEPAETALLKLASVLKADAGVGEEIEQAARELARHPVQENYQPIFREVVRGYVYRKKIEIVYRPLTWSKSFQTTFSTYLLEPSPLGFTTYLIGHSSIVNQWRAYKLERIESARIIKDSYSVPPEFPGLDILRNAWSIVMGKDTTRVLLRFRSETAKARVLETRWHPSQQTYLDPDDPNALLLEFKVADTLDLLPWIRSWGADCEVLEPERLQNDLKGEVKRMARQYGLDNSAPKPAYFYLWAKADKKPPHAIHRLFYHLIDVGQVALALWEEALPAVLKQELAETLGLQPEEAKRLIAFWAALHDLGKASPIFQWHPRLSASLQKVIQSELISAGLFPKRAWLTTRITRHEIISAWALTMQGNSGLLASETNLPSNWARKVASALGGHHGIWPKGDAFSDDQLPPDHRGGQEWDAVRQALVSEMKDIFQPPLPQGSIEDLNQEQENAFFTLLSAFFSIADWIGSDEQHFIYRETALATNDYIAWSAQQAMNVLREMGWLARPHLNGIVNFDIAFDNKPPRPIQEQVIAEARDTLGPVLVVLEAPTGIGKTEVALYLADQWIQRKEHVGFYIAMPTTATSNQMHDRVSTFVRERYGPEVQPLLVHSQAELKPIDTQSENVDGFEDSDKEQDRATALSWFLPRKKSLLFPFGVGTVDQALMSILQTKHFFVRLFGLSRKVVIFDEVHAYDTYMSELFKRLLEWLRELDVSVILLSATLPEKARREFVQAYTGQSMSSSADYPRLTIATRETETRSIALPKPKPRPLQLEWVKRDPLEIARRLQTELRYGGCAAVICNTVDRAQLVYQTIVDSQPDCDVTLFHARTPRVWRKKTEDYVIAHFGPPDKVKTRPHKSIVVATQVIEQSLDLDFDVIISDLAPVDLLLQRAGRLHRHDRGKRNTPRLLITVSMAEQQLPNFENDRYVYAPFYLLRSYFALRHRPGLVLTLPDDTSALIEQVYGDEEIDDLTDVEKNALNVARHQLVKTTDDDVVKARAKLVLHPSRDNYLTGSGGGLDEDNPELHNAFRALTRKDEPGLQLLCLHQTDRGWVLDPDNTDSPVFAEDVLPNPEQVTGLLQSVVAVRRHAVLNHFLMTDLPKKWCKIPALRHHRLAVFANHIYDDVRDCQIRLTRDLGLQFVPRKENHEFQFNR